MRDLGETRLRKRPLRENYPDCLLEHLIEPLDRRVCVVLGFELNFGVLPVAAVDFGSGADRRSPRLSLSLTPHVRAVQLEEVEGVEERLRLAPSVAKQLEGGQPPFVTAHDFPVDQARPHLEVVDGLDHQWIACRPVMTAPGDKPDAHGIAPGHQPEAVVLDLVNPVGVERGLVG